MNANALFLTSHPWLGSVRVSSHQLAHALARRGWNVGFVAAPISPAHIPRARRDGRFAAWRLPQRTNGVHGIQPMSIIPLYGPVLRSKLVLDHWPRLTVPPIRRLLHTLDLGEPDITFIDSAVTAVLTGSVRSKRTVYRITDYTPGFRSHGDVIDRLEKRFVSQADLVLATSPQLVEHAEHQGARHTLVVGQGVDIDHFRPPRPMPSAYETIPGPRAVFVGMLEHWVDTDLLVQTAQANPDLHVVVIGPDKVLFAQRCARENLPNLHYLGPVPHDQLPAYLQHANVGLIPFRSDAPTKNLVNAVNPIKLYEYLAAGLPVVSTRSSTIEGLNSPAHIAEPAEFPAQVAQCANDGLAPHDTHWVDRQSWGAVLDAILAELDAS